MNENSPACPSAPLLRFERADSPLPWTPPQRGMRGTDSGWVSRRGPRTSGCGDTERGDARPPGPCAQACATPSTVHGPAARTGFGRDSVGRMRTLHGGARQSSPAPWVPFCQGGHFGNLRQGHGRAGRRVSAQETAHVAAGGSEAKGEGTSTGSPNTAGGRGAKTGRRRVFPPLPLSIPRALLPATSSQGWWENTLTALPLHHPLDALSTRHIPKEKTQ